MTRLAFSKIAILVVLGALAGCADQKASGERGLTSSERAAIAQATVPSLARVEYTVQYDQGEPPTGSGYQAGELGGFVLQERPMELPGYVLSPTLVVCPDPIIHPRFVKSINVHMAINSCRRTLRPMPRTRTPCSFNSRNPSRTPNRWSSTPTPNPLTWL